MQEIIGLGLEHLTASTSELISPTGSEDDLKLFGGRGACNALNIAVRAVSPSLMEIVGPSALSVCGRPWFWPHQNRAPFREG